jgi:hypothetical protein
LNVVQEDRENDSAVTAEEVKNRDLGDNSEEEDWGRSPERVDLDNVDVTSPSKKQRKPAKPLVSKEEAEEILER